MGTPSTDSPLRPISGNLSTVRIRSGDFPRQTLLYHGFSAKELDCRASFSLSAQFGVCLFSSGIPVRPPVRQTNEGDTNTFAWHGAMLSAQSFVHEFISSFKRTKLLSLSGPSGKENSSVRDAIRILTPSWSITRENG